MKDKTTTLPMIPIINAFMLPNMQRSLTVSREGSIKTLEQIQAGSKVILMTQREPNQEIPRELEEYFPVATVASVQQMQRAGASWEVLLKVHNNIIINSIDQEAIKAGHAMQASGTEKREPEMDEEVRQAAINLSEALQQLEEVSEGDIKLSELIQDLDPVRSDVQTMEYLKASWESMARISQETSVAKRIEIAREHVALKVTEIKITEEINSKAERKMSQDHRRAVLSEKIRIIQRELGENQELEERIKKSDLPEHVQKRLTEDLTRMTRAGAFNQEASVLREYIETMLSVPWKQKSAVEEDIKVIEEKLNQSHYGMTEVKKRVLEMAGVERRLARKKLPSSGKVMLLVGPPGVGKTSVAVGIASSTGRRLARVALGGLRDESEIRGHRRTYIGAMPGRIAKALIQAGSNNPVILLDEIDKMGSENGVGRGDPAAALLEVLDPSQLAEFKDRYLDEPIDLSGVTFIATANSLSSIPRPLLDRMEVIEIPSYSQREKEELTQRWLIPKTAQKVGLEGQLTFSKEAVQELIDGYTHEAGVRELTRLCERIAQHASLRAEKENHTETAGEKTEENWEIKINQDDIAQILGPRRVPKHRPMNKRVGAAQGMYYSEAGGGLMLIETDLTTGTGKVSSSGSLGKVMGESIEIAWRVARQQLEKPAGRNLPGMDIHVHLPDGATPKDGPSAGAAIVAAMVSALEERSITDEIAVTGEVNLHGEILAIGGVREKVAGALRNGVKQVIIPLENKKDIEVLPEDLQNSLKTNYVTRIEEVLSLMLEPRKNKHKEKETHSIKRATRSTRKAEA